jgi:S-adenosylmethionine:tRNA ribosyltransferase-isomerase
VRAASWPREQPLRERLLLVDPQAGQWRDALMGDLPSVLRPDDLLVVNDAATLPASLRATVEGGAPRLRLAPLSSERAAPRDPVELRLAARLEDGSWRAVLFGAGDWRTRTELRPAPPVVASGDRLRIAADLYACVEEVDPRASRLIRARFSLDGAALWVALHRYGRPIQYSHVAGPLEPWHVQTAFASRPWAVEMPSAGRPLTWDLLGALRARGVRTAPLTHAAGLSSTGDPRIDAALPLPERYDIPAATARAVAETRRAGGRIVAAGTTVVRALEGASFANGTLGDVVAGEGTTDLHIDARFRPHVVSGLLTGLHEIGSSHRELLQAFAPEELLARAWKHAEAGGYLGHEFGDLCLVLPHGVAV